MERVWQAYLVVEEKAEKEKALVVCCPAYLVVRLGNMERERVEKDFSQVFLVVKEKEKEREEALSILSRTGKTWLLCWELLS